MAKRRHMKNFVGMQGLAIKRLGQDIAMALAKGVVHLHHDGGQCVVAAVAVPKTDGLEGIAPNAGIAVQPHLALGIVDVLALQQFIQPRQCATRSDRATIAMVNIVERNGCASVHGQYTFGLFCQAAHGQQQKPSGVGKCVAARPSTAVANLAKTDERLGRAHAKASCLSVWRASKPCAAAKPAW